MGSDWYTEERLKSIETNKRGVEEMAYLAATQGWSKGRSYLRTIFLMNSVVDTRFEAGVLEAEASLARMLDEFGYIHGEIASPRGVRQWSDRIERCVWCEAPFADSEDAERAGDENYDLCPRCRRYPEEDPLLNAIDRGIDDEGLDRLIEHYAKETPYFTEGQARRERERRLKGENGGEDVGEDGADVQAR